MKGQKLNYLVLTLGLLLFFSDAQAQLLKGIIKADSIPDIQIAYTPDGDMLSTVYQIIKVDEEGNFRFDINLPQQTCDVDISVGNYIFGAHLEKGKTTNISLKQKKGESGYDIKYKGENDDLSRVYNAYAQAFDIMKYFSPDPEMSKTPEEYRDLLDKEYAKVKKVLAKIKDAKSKVYYTQLSEGRYAWSKLRIIMDKAFEENKTFKDYKEYNQIIETIDPNDPINIRTNLLFSWIGGIGKVNSNTDGDNTDFYLENMEIVTRDIKNPAVRRSLTRYIAYSFFNYGNGNVNTFWNKYKEFAKDYPEFIRQYESKVSSMEATSKGKVIPYNPILTKTDGTICKLSDLFGTFIYIDIWATWCGPCCKEIPHLEKIAEHFKGNDRIKIISISVDENKNAWLKKLEKDQPKWPQYILSPEEEDKFMSAWSIGGIPRFIMLDKDGKIFSADALRPSNEALVTTIESQL